VRWSLVVATLLLAGCGSSAPAGAPEPAASPPAPVVRTPRQQRDLARLSADVRAIRRAAAKADHVTLMGTPALQRTTGAFLDRLDRSSLEPKMKNRMIDFAASAAAGSCEQCFQMLEAARPIPEIAH
jgi:hypothetical protein